MDVWGKYRLLNKVAQGGMAEIYAAEPLEAVDNNAAAMIGPICIKCIRPEFSDDPEFLRMFSQEAHIAMALKHPNVVNVFDSDIHDGRLFIVMEFVYGWDLKKVLSEVTAIGAAVPVGFAFHVFRSLLGALQAAENVTVDGERQTVVHRDISPHNLLVSKDGAVKLTDFGIAKARGSSRVTRTGIIKGKLAYLSPEQAASKEVTPASDLFCAGLVLYELLSGQRFNQGKSDGEMLAAVINPREPNIPWMSEDINRFLSIVLAPEPNQRGETLATVLEATNALDLPAYTAADAAQFVRGLIAAKSHATPRNGVLSRISSSAIPQPDPQATATEAFDDVPTRTSSEVPRPGGSQTKKKTWFVAVGMVLVVAALTTLFFVFGLRLFSGESVGAESDEAMALVQESVSIQTDKKEPAVRSDDVSSVAPSSTRTPDIVVNLASEDSDTSRPVAESTGVGRLEVMCRPWAHVSINGKPAGTTPLKNFALPPGKHLVELHNEALGFEKKRYVTVRSGKTSRLNENISFAKNESR